MHCHNCPHSEAILRGDYDSKPWDELPCATCSSSDNLFLSVPLDEDRPPVPCVGYSTLPPDGDLALQCEKTSVPLVEEMPVAVLADFIDAFMELPPEQRDIVAWRFKGVRYKEIARRQGTSIQLAEMRHKIAIRECPVLRTLFPEKVAKRRCRRPHR